MEGLKACMRYIFILSVMIIAGVFATDWWFTRDGDLLNDTLVGVMIGRAHRLVRCFCRFLHH